MKEEEFEQKRSLLLALLKLVPEIRGRTRLQKIVFLGQKELGLPPLFDYSKHYYGPYSKDLIDTIDQMIMQGDIVENEENLGEYTRYTYKLSDQEKSVQESIPDLSLDLESKDALKKLSNVPLKKILEYVYSKY